MIDLSNLPDVMRQVMRPYIAPTALAQGPDNVDVDVPAEAKAQGPDLIDLGPIGGLGPQTQTQPQTNFGGY